MDKAGTQKVWDGLVRVLHWSLVTGIASAWLTSNDYILEKYIEPHKLIGYGIIAIITLRLIWGFVGTRYARFTQFVRNPLLTARYAFSLFKGQSLRYIGHNPLGAYMILALLLAVATVCATGVMMGTDQFFGEEWVENLHKDAAIIVLVLAGVHVVGVVASSLMHKENLVKAMLTGKKAVAQASDVDD